MNKNDAFIPGLILIKPGLVPFEFPEEKTELEYLQKLVNGYIQLCPGYYEAKFHNRVLDYVMFCNEEGKILNLPFNELATYVYRTMNPGTPDHIQGPAVLVWNELVKD